MKNCLLFILLFSFLSGFGQDAVVTYAQKKSVVLEEFTGIHCVFCPDGHRIAKEMKANNPGRVSLINVHAGFFATPDEGEPDFRVQDGITLDSHFGVTGYPSGTVNRRTFDGDNNYSRSLWAQYGSQIIDETSVVNLAATSTYDEATRKLNVEVEVYYALSAENPENRLILALTQDNLEGPQTGGSNFNPDDVLPNGNYRHGHMLRDFLEGPFGHTITETTAGSYSTYSFEYDLPEQINGIPLVADDCDLVIYVAEGEEDIQTGIDLKLNGANDGQTERVFLAANKFPSDLVNSTDEGSALFSTTFYPYVEGMGEFRIEIETLDAPEDWTWEYSLVADASYSQNETFTLTEGEIQYFDFKVIPSAGGVGNYMVSIIPVDYPNDRIEMSVTVVHDCSELIINSEQATKNDANNTAEAWGSLYLQAFKDAGLESYGAISVSQYDQLVKSSQLAGIKNIYFNSGWASEPLPSTFVLNLLRHNSSGGNIFLCGQDLATDVYDNGSALIQNYLRTNMGVQVANTGGNANSSVISTGGGIFDGLSSVTLTDYYGAGSISPDVLRTTSSSEANLSYDNNGSLVAGVNKTGSSYKSVTLGFGLEMVESDAQRAAIMKDVYNYFYGITNNDENEALNASVAIYPNPVVDGTLNISIQDYGSPLNGELVNAAGQVVFNMNQLNTGANTIQLPSNVQTGIYVLKLNFEEGIVTKPILVE